MLWIAGLMAITLLGTVLMCILIIGGRADERMELSKLTEPSTSLPLSDDPKIRVVLEGLIPDISLSDLWRRGSTSTVLYDYDSPTRDFRVVGKPFSGKEVFVPLHRTGPWNWKKRTFH